MFESVQNYSLHEAKQDAEQQMIFLSLFRKMNGHEKSQLNRNEFVQLVQCINRSISEIKAIEIFNLFTRKSEQEADEGKREDEH